KKNIKKIAILSADNAFSKSLAQSTRKWAQRFKLSVVIFETFEEERKNLQDLAEKAKTSESGAIIVCGHLNESVRMRRALAAIDWYPKAYFASVGPATDKYRDLLKNEANLTFSASQWEKNVSIHFPRGKTFTDAFYDKYKMEPTYHAAAVYAAGMILEDVVKKGGTMNRETIRQILSNLNTLTVIGRYGVDSKGKQLRRFPLIIQWQNGEKKVVWPEKIKEASAMILE
ncbi:MAG: ABC transporter substrate-binding protein, partial [Desulfobacteraceae bacterium]|nr:ABC transporter substrate-binding protein [Desulfobacteraceae bacterium]